jgi:hypothetical protein
VTTFKTAAALLLLFGGAAKAAPIAVDFSFTGTSGAAGTVTGQLVFAGAGTGIAATDVYVFTAPGNTISPSELDVDFAPFGTIDHDVFTVSASGAISSADLEVYDPQNDEVLALVDGNLNELRYFGSGGTLTSNAGGLSAITFTPVAYVPEPGSVAILGGALLALAMVRRRYQA